MRLKFFLVICSLLLSLSAFAQLSPFQSYYYPNSDLYLHDLVTTQDDGYLLITSRNCYIEGGGIAIEGCLIEMYLIRINAQGDTLWTSTIPTENSYFVSVKGRALSNGQFSILLTEPSNNFCQDIFTAPWGWDRTKAFRISESGVLVDELNYQQECTLNMQDVLSLENDEQIVLLNYSDEPFGSWNGRLMRLDGDNQPIWTVDFVDKDFQSAQLIRKDDIRFYILYQRSGAYWMSSATYDGAIEWTTMILDNVSMRLQDAILLEGEDVAVLFHQPFGNRYLEAVRLNASGGVVWNKTLDFTNQGKLFEQENALLVATTTTGPDEDQEITLIALSHEGDSLSTATLAMPAWEDPQILFDAGNGTLGIAGNIVCCGSPEDFDPSGVFWGRSDFIVVSAEEVYSEHEQISVYPNPANTFIQVEWEAADGQYAQIRIVDQLGRIVQAGNYRSFPIRLDTREWAEGVYYVQLYTAGRLLTEKVLLAR